MHTNTKTKPSLVSKIVGPRVVGGRYFNGYWHMGYTVTDIVDYTMSCLWDDGHTTTHTTAWDAKRDRVLPA